MPDVHALVNDFLIKLKKRKIEGSKTTAKVTAEVLRSFISQQRLPSTNQAGALIDAVRGVGEQLIAANPVELAVGNVVRRVLHIIREEELTLTSAAIGGMGLSAGSDDEDEAEHDGPDLSAAIVAAAARNTLRPPSLQTLLEDLPHTAAVPHTYSSGGDSDGKSKSVDRNSNARKLKHNVIEAVNELIQDIATCHEQIAEQAVEHIHHNEVILTLGSSRTVVEFLCAAKEKKRSFKVFVAEGAPRYQGHALAKELITRGLQTTVITDSAVFAMISRVNMVIVGAHAVMANGGVIAPVGLNMVALAAQRHAVPFVVLAGIHKSHRFNPSRRSRQQLIAWLQELEDVTQQIEWVRQRIDDLQDELNYQLCCVVSSDLPEGNIRVEIFSCESEFDSSEDQIIDWSKPLIYDVYPDEFLDELVEDGVLGLVQISPPTEPVVDKEDLERA